MVSWLSFRKMPISMKPERILLQRSKRALVRIERHIPLYLSLIIFSFQCCDDKCTHSSVGTVFSDANVGHCRSGW